MCKQCLHKILVSEIYATFHFVIFENCILLQFHNFWGAVCCLLAVKTCLCKLNLAIAINLATYALFLGKFVFFVLIVFSCFPCLIQSTIYISIPTQTFYCIWLFMAIGNNQTWKKTTF